MLGVVMSSHCQAACSVQRPRLAHEAHTICCSMCPVWLTGRKQRDANVCVCALCLLAHMWRSKFGMRGRLLCSGLLAGAHMCAGQIHLLRDLAGGGIGNAPKLRTSPVV